jgi:hypothetical protein
MKEENELKLVKRFPIIFRDYKEDPRNTPMAWGFECGDGWFQLIWDLCENIEKLAEGKDIYIIAEQVKQKFGRLRFYYHPVSEKLSKYRIRNFMFQKRLGKEYHAISGIRKKIWKSVEEKIDDAINKAESDSGKICEKCGNPGELSGKSYVQTLCKECFNEWVKK